ncbi:sulfatase [Arthrobacter sp. 2RAF6]|uniref:sulfatase family protein n=1 Tax=Arthrobacter sp. 2RAF6 TaxID=3233002 RepID=UPI003F8EFE99
MNQPNILWISTHDINPDLGCYTGVWPGAEYAVTPNLDRLAAEGARFDHAFASAPVCAPARSAIMTGCFPTVIGTMHMRTKAVPPPEVRLLPEYFRQAGYYCTNNWFTDFQVDIPPTVFDDCSPVAHWRNRPNPGTPFFAVFHGMATHESRIYVDDDAFEAAVANVGAADRHDPALAPLPPYYPDTAVFRRAWARYADLITKMDHWVGTILDLLEEDGLAQNTIVVFWSDHGKGMPRAKRWATEAGLREPLIIRWPDVIPAGTVREDLVHTMDLAPTMLHACGLPVPEHMHGVPLVGPDGSFVEDPNEYVYGGRDRMDEAEDTSRTVRDQRFRYIRNFHPDRPPMLHTDYPDRLPTWAEFRRIAAEEARQLACGEPRSLFTELQRTLVAASKPAEELYDLLKDPHETQNLVADPAYGADLDRFRDALARWQGRFGDLGLVDEAELIERWRPAGLPRTTAEPIIVQTPHGLEAECLTDGASIAWTTDPPGPIQDRSLMERAAGSPEHDGRRWHLYSGPVLSEGAEQLWFRAWRIGFQPSQEILAPVPVRAEHAK